MTMISLSSIGNACFLTREAYTEQGVLARELTLHSKALTVCADFMTCLLQIKKK